MPRALHAKPCAALPAREQAQAWAAVMARVTEPAPAMDAGRETDVATAAAEMPNAATVLTWALASVGARVPPRVMSTIKATPLPTRLL